MTRCAAAIFAIFTAVTAVGVILAQSPTDFAGYVDIAISNNSTTTDLLGPVPASINANNLVVGGHVNNEASDTLFTDSGNVQVGGFGQDLSQNDVNWWWFADVPAGQVGSMRLFMSGPTSTHLFPFGTSTDRIVVSDDATLQITDNLTVAATTTLYQVPAAETFLVNKDEAYQLGVRSSNEVFGRVYYSAGSTTIRPDGDVATNISTTIGCTSHYDCIDEASADDNTTLLRTLTGNTEEDTFSLGNAGLAADDVVTRVEVFFRCVEYGVGFCRPSLKLGGSTATGTEVALSGAWTTYSEEFTSNRPGGGSWTPSDIDSLQALIRLRSTSDSVNVTQLYVEVDHYKTAEVSHSPIASSTVLGFRMTFDNPDLHLFVDGDLKNSSTTSATLTATSDNVVIGQGIVGGIGPVWIGDTSTTSPTWRLQLDMQPDEIAETQEGNAGNSWSWQGTVTDQSAGANDGTYYIARDMTDLEVEVGGLWIVPEAPPGPASQEAPDVVGSPPLAVFLTPQPTVASQGRSVFLDPLDQAAEQSGMPREGWWLLVTTVVATVACAKLFRFLPSFVVAAVLGGIIYAIVAFTAGLTLWFLAFYGLWSAGSISIHQYWSRGG